MVKLLIEKDSHELDLFRLKEFDWPFSVQLVYEGEFDAVLKSGGVCLKLNDEETLTAPFSWQQRIVKWSKDKTINTNLLKALGTKKGGTVIDATLGFGDDSSFLLSQGLKLHCFERFAPLFFVHQAALLLEQNLNLPLTLNFGSASKSLKEADKVNAIYFDPMFSDGKERKAKPRKEMSFLHSRIGSDDDAMTEAMRLRVLSKRLVIKRTPKAKDLLENKNSSWKTKAVRFDLYL